MGTIHGNYMRTINKIITPVCSTRALGRSNIGTRPKNKKVFDCFVPMSNDGAYDTGGAYWGAPIHGTKPLRISYTKDLTYIRFYRNYSRKD